MIFEYRYEKLLSYKNDKCDKCEKKVILVIGYQDPIIALCDDHAPKMNDGSPGYKEFTVLYKDERPLSETREYNSKLRKFPTNRCVTCGQLTQDKSKFIKQRAFPSPAQECLEALPIEPFKYWIHKKIEYCWEYEDHNEKIKVLDETI